LNDRKICRRELARDWVLIVISLDVTLHQFYENFSILSLEHRNGTGGIKAFCKALQRTNLRQMPSGPARMLYPALQLTAHLPVCPRPLAHR